MLRCALFLVAAVAIVAPVQSAAPDVSGNWILSTVNPTGGESVVCVLKTEVKDGKPTATVLFSPPNAESMVSEFKATDTTVSVTVKTTRTFKTAKGDQKFTTEAAFAGTLGKDGKVVLGSVGDYRSRTRAKLIATDKDKLEANELFVRGEVPEPMTKLLQLNSKVANAQNKLFQEKDAYKKKELQKEFVELRKEAEAKTPGLYREVVETSPDSPAALTAAAALLRTAARSKVKPDEAEKFVALVQKQAAPYGALFSNVTLAPIADALVGVKGLEGAALLAVEPIAKTLSDKDPLAFQSEVLGTYKAALEKTGKASEAKAIAVRWAKVETALDTEFLKTVPPFKPVAFEGRKDKTANQVVVMELFTGAQCPPCVAADVAFDALQKSYKPTDVVLLQYHMHIPGPDPLTNTDTVARWDYYQKEFPEGIRGTPSTLFNGKPQAGGGGGMTNAENKFKQYAEIINPLLEKTTDVKVVGKASRTGDKVEIGVEVTGASDDLKLRLLVVEESVKYVGSNGLRFHHQVVRAMPGGADGVAVKDKAFKHSATVNLADVRKTLTKYLDEYAENTRPFPKSDRPMDMKTLRVVALVQNDKTREIVQALQIDVEGKAAGGQ